METKDVDQIQDVNETELIKNSVISNHKDLFYKTELKLYMQKVSKRSDCKTVSAPALCPEVPIYLHYL